MAEEMKAPVLARTNLAEAVELVLESNRALTEERLGAKRVIREPLRFTA
jgi:hypothetical protein